MEIEGSTDPLADLEALRRAELRKRLLAQQWSPPLLAAATNAATTKAPPVRSSRKVFSFEKGASALRSPVAYANIIQSRSRTEQIPFSHRSPNAFADDKGATALMMILAPVESAAELDWDAQLLETVEIAPDAVRTLAVERARNVKTYLLQTGKVEGQRITESARGDSSKGSRVYLWLQ